VEAMIVVRMESTRKRGRRAVVRRERDVAVPLFFMALWMFVLDRCLRGEERGRRGEGSGKLKLPCELRGVREFWLVCEYVGLEREERGSVCCGSEKKGFKKLSLC
jgi:hypothetical protein